jgi:spermidine/putrescine transport system ATP-binding protein
LSLGHFSITLNAMKTKGALRLERISRTFGDGGEDAAGVHEVNLEIPQGEGFSLLGPSGCGKSTTLRIIGGFERPDTGRVKHGDTDITDFAPQERDIRTVFQRYALFPHLGVADNIAFGLRMQKRPESEITEKVKWGLELLQINHLRSRPVLQLSGGEQQRVALARALVTEPSVLLLDEPLSALDLKLRERMQLELLALRQKLGSTFIFVTHDQGEAMTVSDRIAVMRGGRIMQLGTPEEIYHRPTSRFVAEFIGQANFLAGNRRGLIQGDLERLPALKDDQSWMVRPEHFTPRPLDWKAPGGFVGLKARVTEMAFLGPERLTKAQDADGCAYLVKTPGFEPAPGRVGEEILISWETEDTWTVASS